MNMVDTVRIVMIMMDTVRIVMTMMNTVQSGKAWLRNRQDCHEYDGYSQARHDY